MSKSGLGLVLFVVFLGSLQAFAQEKIVVPTISVCELLKHPEQYSEKLIRIEAVRETYYHGAFFYDRCDDRTIAIDTVVNCSENKNCAEIQKDIDLKSAGTRIGLVAVGTFHYQRLNEYGFGHLNGSEFQVSISRVEKTFSVPANFPNPGETKTDKNAAEVNVLEFDLKEAGEGNTPSRAGSGRSIENILADDFRLINVDGEIKSKAMYLSESKQHAQPLAGIRYDRMKAYGDVVVVTGRLSTVASEKKKVGRYINIYVKREGKMQLVSTQITTVSDK